MQDRSREVGEKQSWLRSRLGPLGAGAIRLRGSDWFAWATAGASNTALLAAETGVAEVLVTEHEALEAP